MRTGTQIFCEKVSMSTGRSLAGPVRWECFNRPANLYIFHDIRENLKPQNLPGLEERYTRTFPERAGQALDERTLFLPLAEPLTVEGTILRSLRWKGVHPVTSSGNEVAAYTSGKGYVTRRIEVSSPWTLTAREDKNASDYTPVGVMEEESLFNEITGSLAVGPANTDLMLGFGIFDNLSFNGAPVGFCLYGMEKASDTRVLGHFLLPAQAEGLLPDDAAAVAQATGRILRSVNNKLLFHAYAHLNNFAHEKGSGTRITDLEETIDIAEKPANLIPTYLYRDIFEAMNNYYRISNFPAWRNKAEGLDTYTAHLVPHFLWGYFGGNTTLRFCRAIEPFVKSGATEEDINKTFGWVPKYRRGDGGNDLGVSLAEPCIRMLRAPSLHLPLSSDLKQYAQETAVSLPLFGLYLEALCTVADNILKESAHGTH